MGKKNRNGYNNKKHPISMISRGVTDGLYRLTDTLTFSSGSGGDHTSLVSRSFTQFAESSYLDKIYTEIRLIAFTMTVSPSPEMCKTDSVPSNLSMGWMALGTTPASTVVNASSANQVLAQSDSRSFYLRNAIRPIVFNSAIKPGGYQFTPFASEDSYAFAGCPGTIYVKSVLSAGLPASSTFMYGVICGIYQFTGRTT